MKGVYDVKSDYEGTLSKRDDGVMELSLDVGVSVKNIRGRADGVSSVCSPADDRY
jgi:hypothetical protein